jgi:hypothetical protein
MQSVSSYVRCVADQQVDLERIMTTHSKTEAGQTGNTGFNSALRAHLPYTLSILHPQTLQAASHSSIYIVDSTQITSPAFELGSQRKAMT